MLQNTTANYSSIPITAIKDPPQNIEFISPIFGHVCSISDDFVQHRLHSSKKTPNHFVLSICCICKCEAGNAGSECNFHLFTKFLKSIIHYNLWSSADVKLFFITVLNRNETSKFPAALAYVFDIHISLLLWLCTLPASEQLLFISVAISHNLMLFLTYCLDKEVMICLYSSERCNSFSFFFLTFQPFLTHLLPFWTPASHKIFSGFRFLV